MGNYFCGKSHIEWVAVLQEETLSPNKETPSLASLEIQFSLPKKRTEVDSSEPLSALMVSSMEEKNSLISPESQRKLTSSGDLLKSRTTKCFRLKIRHMMTVLWSVCALLTSPSILPLTVRKCALLSP